MRQSPWKVSGSHASVTISIQQGSIQRDNKKDSKRFFYGNGYIYSVQEFATLEIGNCFHFLNYVIFKTAKLHCFERTQRLLVMHIFSVFTAKTVCSVKWCNVCLSFKTCDDLKLLKCFFSEAGKLWQGSTFKTDFESSKLNFSSKFAETRMQPVNENVTTRGFT